MKIIGFNGSPRKDGNATTLMGYVFREIEKEGIETELVQLSAKAIPGCIACYKCFDNRERCGERVYRKDDNGSGYRFGISFLFSGCNSGDEGLDRPGGLRRIGKWEDVQKQNWGCLILFSSHRRDAYYRNHEPFLLQQRTCHRRSGIERCPGQRRVGKR
jgi:hypothetical protein